jgi:hypothetical protein
VEKDDEIGPHNGKPINSLAPNGKYLITYSKDDHSIVGWDVKDINKETKYGTEDEERLKPEITIKINDKYKRLNQICVSDDKKLVIQYVLNHYNE